MTDTRLNSVQTHIAGGLQEAVSWLKHHGIPLADFVIVERFGRSGGYAHCEVFAYEFVAPAPEGEKVLRNVATYIPVLNSLMTQPGPTGQGRLYLLPVTERQQIGWLLESELH
jgi:hypothetical protein